MSDQSENVPDYECTVCRKSVPITTMKRSVCRDCVAERDRRAETEREAYERRRAERETWDFVTGRVAAAKPPAERNIHSLALENARRWARSWTFGEPQTTTDGRFFVCATCRVPKDPFDDMRRDAGAKKPTFKGTTVCDACAATEAVPV